MSLEWPNIPYAPWRETCSALHLYTQIVGKYRLAHTPWVNHSWHATFYINSCGLTTSLVPDILSINTSNIGELLGRVSWVKPVEVFIRTSPTTDRDSVSGVSLHFEGSDWKLSGINLPKSVTRQLAASLPVK